MKMYRDVVLGTRQKEGWSFGDGQESGGLQTGPENLFSGDFFGTQIRKRSRERILDVKLRLN